MMKKKAEPAPTVDEKSIESVEMKKRESTYTKYAVPNNTKQILEVMRLEFIHYFKGKGIVVLYILAAVFPLLEIIKIGSFSISIVSFITTFSAIMTGSATLTSLQYLHYCLLFLPTVMVLAMFILCGKTISKEYTDRTCFLNFPLPVEKWVLFTGKYLAVAITSFSIILLNYGCAMLVTNMKYGTIVIMPVIQSILLSFASMLALISVGMLFSCALKNRSGIASLMTVMFLIPLIPMALSLGITDIMDKPISFLVEMFQYTPPFGTDVALIVLGWDPTMSMSGFVIGQVIGEVPSFWVEFIVMLLWAAGLFFASIKVFERREV